MDSRVVRFQGGSDHQRPQREAATLTRKMKMPSALCMGTVATPSPIATTLDFTVLPTAEFSGPPLLVAVASFVPPDFSF